MSYIENEQEFRLFMDSKGLATGSQENYICWLRYLSNNGINIDSNLESNDFILRKLRASPDKRVGYNSEKDYSNFGSALNKYREFMDCSSVSLLEDIGLRKDANEKNVNITERDELIKARIGQGLFRKKLIKLWQSCAVTGFPKPEFLIASHILPWRKSSNNERLNEYNGLLLQPNFDIYFDKGYISFDDNGNIILSKKIEEKTFNKMGVFADNKLTKVFEENKPFLRRHKEMFKDILSD
ncbi:MAG: HNH endonuclease [Planctomycetota bacterium]|jgi:hypothetical protein|nr:HNH endonuclease [Planctomycetota bacterium]